MNAFIISLVLSLCLNGYAIFYALFGDMDSIGGVMPIFLGFLGLGPTVFCCALLVTRRETLNKTSKILGVISILSIFLIPISINNRKVDKYCNKQKNQITLLNGIQSWFFDSKTKKFYLLKKDAKIEYSGSIPYSSDFDLSVSPVSCKDWVSNGYKPPK